MLFVTLSQGSGKHPDTLPDDAGGDTFSLNISARDIRTSPVLLALAGDREVLAQWSEVLIRGESLEARVWAAAATHRLAWISAARTTGGLRDGGLADFLGDGLRALAERVDDDSAFLLVTMNCEVAA